MNVMRIAITRLEAISATVLDLAIDFTVMAPLVKVTYTKIIGHRSVVAYYNNIPVDIDECAEDRDGCAQICTDTDSSYFCSCEVGYDLARDRHGCNGEKKTT